MYDHLRASFCWLSAMMDANYRENYWTVVATNEAWYGILNAMLVEHERR